MRVLLVFGVLMALFAGRNSPATATAAMRRKKRRRKVGLALRQPTAVEAAKDLERFSYRARWGRSPRRVVGMSQMSPEAANEAYRRLSYDGLFGWRSERA